MLDEVVCGDLTFFRESRTMVSCCICAIGSEILQGAIIDTNSGFIGARLEQAGLSVAEIRSLPDDEAVLIGALIASLDRYELIITTGGLGPTFDDITAQAVSKATGRECVFYEGVYAHIEQMLSSRNVPLKETHKRQACLPADVVLLPNPVGTAPGFVVDTGRSVIISLPGVPHEMQPMFEVHVQSFLKERFAVRPRFNDVLRFAGVPESDVDEQIKNVGLSDKIRCIINASKGEILVRVQSEENELLNEFTTSLRERLTAYYVSRGDETIATTLVKLLHSEEESLAVAESLTGGQIGQTITMVPGSSAVFIGGIIAYSDWAKIQQLGVSQALIKQHGPVSHECALSMVRNISRLFQTDAAIAVTGLAGPGGGSAEIPVGTVFIALQYHERLNVKQFSFSGGRESIRDRTVKTAITRLIKMIHHTSRS